MTFSNRHAVLLVGALGVLVGCGSDPQVPSAATATASTTISAAVAATVAAVPAVRVTDAKGLEWMPATELVLRREITSSDIEVVNRAQEEELLFREMESDFVQQLLRRLSALKPRG